VKTLTMAQSEKSWLAPWSEQVVRTYACVAPTETLSQAGENGRYSSQHVKQQRSHFEMEV